MGAGSDNTGAKPVLSDRVLGPLIVQPFAPLQPLVDALRNAMLGQQPIAQ